MRKVLNIVAVAAGVAASLAAIPAADQAYRFPFYLGLTLASALLSGGGLYCLWRSRHASLTPLRETTSQHPDAASARVHSIVWGLTLNMDIPNREEKHENRRNA